jgi:hypothetical protein
MFRPLRAILRWDILLIIFLFLKDTYISSVDHTNHEKITWHILQDIIAHKRLRRGRYIATAYVRQAIITRRMTKSLHCPQLDHHEADGLAGQKLGRPPRPPREDTNTPYIDSVYYS